MRNSAKYIPHQACHNQSFHQCHHQVLELFEPLTWEGINKICLHVGCAPKCCPL